ncbi:MAG: response regulator transcription factor [Deltaproteobacteria bacterium]|jgi:two-component system OmpR family response regulator|nr:response regulator transcription factor [Deltaproteobacteria bacterium]
MTESPAKATVLAVDDDPHIAEVLEFALTAAGYEVILESTGERAMEVARTASPNLIILDINLPGLDGLHVCRKLRESSRVPIIFLSARDDEVDRVMGLTLGGDDYVTKPFSPRELVARVEAVLRRPGAMTREDPAALSEGSPPTTLRVGHLTLDLESFEARFKDVHVPLTATEFRILKALAKRPKKVFGRDEILNLISPNVNVGDRTVDSHILHIRKKFQKAGGEVILTQHGLGYSLAPMVDKS